MLNRIRFATVRSALVPVSVIIGHSANLGTQLALPHFLTGTDYSTFATLWAFGQFSSVLFFEWLRFGVVRFSHGRELALATARKHTLGSIYLALSCALLSAAIVFFIAGKYSEICLWISCIGLYAVCQGTFDGRQALARAEFRDLYFSAAWILRSALIFCLVIIFANIWPRPSVVLLAVSASYAISLVLMNRNIVQSLRASMQLNIPEFRFLAQYGGFIAVSSSVTAALPAIVRFSMMGSETTSEGGGQILALDISQKAVLVIGMLVNIVLLQRSIRSVEYTAESKRSVHLARHVAIAAGTILPGALLFYELQSLASHFFVPASYAVDYNNSMALATFASALLCFRQFSIDSVFVIIGQSKLSIYAPLAAILATFAGIGFVILFGVPRGYGVLWALVSGLAVSVAISMYAVKCVVDIVWPYKDMLLVILACALMKIEFILLDFIMQNLLLRIFSIVAVSVPCYFAVLYFGNFCDFKNKLKINHT